MQIEMMESFEIQKKQRVLKIRIKKKCMISILQHYIPNCLILLWTASNSHGLEGGAGRPGENEPRRCPKRRFPGAIVRVHEAMHDHGPYSLQVDPSGMKN